MSDTNHTRPAPGRAGGRTTLSSLLHGPDLRITVTILIVCGVLYYITTTFDSVPVLLSQNIPATWFPRLLIGTIAVLSLILPIEHLFLEAGKEHLDAERKARIEPISMATAALLVLVVLAMPYLGTFLTMVLVSVTLPLLWGDRRWVRLAIYAALFPTAVTLVFTQGLKVYFDMGLLQFLFN